MLQILKQEGHDGPKVAPESFDQIDPFSIVHKSF